MDFRLRWAPDAKVVYEDLKGTAAALRESREKSGKSKPSKQEGLFKQLHKCVKLLGENPRHPGLATHEFSSLQHTYDKNGKVFEAYSQQHVPGAY